MSGIRVGSRLDQLQQLRRNVTVQLEHARRTVDPTRVHDLEQLRDRVDAEIRTEGGTPPPPPGMVVVPRPRRRTTGPTKADLLMAELGVPAATVRAWAIQTGLLAGVTRGRLSTAVVEAYATHQQKAGTTP